MGRKIGRQKSGLIQIPLCSVPALLLSVLAQKLPVRSKRLSGSVNCSPTIKFSLNGEHQSLMSREQMFEKLV